MKYIIKTSHNDPNILAFKKASGQGETSENLRNILKEEQHGKCAYCESKLSSVRSSDRGEHYHTEHIYPSSRYPTKEYCYDNLVLSCGQEDKATGERLKHCGSAKKNYDPKEGFISPLDENCQSYFKYSKFGEIFSDDENGKKTIEKLNLNYKDLKDKRKGVIMAFIRGIEPCDRKKLINNLSEDERFYSAIMYILKNF